MLLCRAVIINVRLRCLSECPKIKESTGMFKSFRASRLLLTTLLILFAFITGAVFGQRRPAAAEPQPAATESDPLKVLQWRAIGPFRGGRSTAVAGGRLPPAGDLFRGPRGRRWEDT